MRETRSSAAPMHRSMSSYEIISARRIALAALAVAACAAAPARAADVTVVEPGGATVVRDDPALPATSDLAAEGVRAPRACAAATATAARARPTVLGALARLERDGALSPADHDRYAAA